MNRIKHLIKLFLQLSATTLLAMVLIVPTGNCFPKKCQHRNRACSEDGTLIPNLYVYSKNDFQKYLKKNNPECFLEYIWKVQRNSSGTSLYLQENFGRKMITISIGGDVRVLTRPAEVAALNDNGEFVIWTDNLLKEIHFTKDSIPGYPLKGNFAIDPSGKYFFIHNLKCTEIRDVNEPDRQLARSNLAGTCIFFIDNKVYLFGQDKSSYNTNGDTLSIKCQIFKKTSTSLEMESEIQIPRSKAGPTPFYVEDVDPSTKNIVLRDVRDAPNYSKYWLYSLDSKTMKQIYLSDYYGYPRFLKDDILGLAK